MRFYVTFILCGFLQIWHASAQENSWVLNPKFIFPARKFDESFSDIKNRSVGLNLGYLTKIKAINHAFIQNEIYLDIYGRQFNFTPRQTKSDYPAEFIGSTIFAGIASTPKYAFVIDENFLLTLGVMFKFGNYWGLGRITQFDQNNGQDQLLEKFNKSAGLGFAVSPIISFEHVTGSGTIGLNVGWDSSKFGKGLNAINSNYIALPDYTSHILTLGILISINSK